MFVVHSDHTPPIRGPVSHGTVLHEIGHVLGRHQESRRVLVRETWAWPRWAKANALLWTPAMERSMTGALAWYAARAKRIDAHWRPMEIVMASQPEAKPSVAAARH